MSIKMHLQPLECLKLKLSAELCLAENIKIRLVIFYGDTIDFAHNINPTTSN